MPPLVRYKIPIIGHTYSYTFNSKEFLKQCKKEYGDIFSIYVWGQVRTIVGKEYSQEILSRDDAFNFGKAFFEIIPYDLLLKHMGLVNMLNMPKLLKEHIFCKLNFYSERMQKCLHSSTQKYIDSNVHDDPKVFDNMYFLIIKIISTPVANVFIGEEESKNDEVVTTFAEFTSDLSALIKIPPFLNFFYPGLLNRILVSSGLYNPAIKHRNILIKYIKNQVCKRLQEKAKYGDSWKRPDDLLQDIIEQEDIDDLNNVNYLSLADKLLLFLFASIHTTSNGCANALMDLASRPQYMQELYEEQLEVHKEADEN
ncbi:cytochrome P450, partial [Rhizophagus irregularis]